MSTPARRPAATHPASGRAACSAPHSRKPRSVEEVHTRRERDAAALAEHLRRAVDEAPSLTFDQLDTIGAILRGARPAAVVSA